MSDLVIRVENISKLYRLGEVGTGSLAHDVNRWWHRVRGKEDPYLKIGEVNDRTKPVSGSKKRNLTTEDTESTEGGAGGNQRADSGEFLEGHSQAGLHRDSEKLASIRSANDSRASRDQTGSDSESVIIRDIRGRNSSSEALDSRPSSLVSPKAPPSDWVYALKDVSFEVKRGEVLGIIGRNGAGKSTLLKILSRVTTQSSGQIKVKGRIASLLEVGTGFHPELTGRENIFLNGAILGMRKAEIARKFDEIVEFSGCARYIDTPVTQATGQPLGRLPQGSPKGETSGNERVNIAAKAARRVNRDLGKVEKDCREAAPKEEQVGKTCESNERERANQPVWLRDVCEARVRRRSALDTRLWTLDPPCGRSLGCGLQLVESYGSERRCRVPKKMPGQNEGCFFKIYSLEMNLI